jgi:Sporulation protein YtfJ (Spore_YtfJ)
MILGARPAPDGRFRVSSRVLAACSGASFCVFGESYQVDGVTIVPVATVRGGGGGGDGEGTATGGDGTGTGAGGFGVIVRPVGVYIVKDGEVSWQPAMDVMRVILGGQLLGLAAIFVLRHLLKRR